eukprot:scaffold35437_cov101-Isochrysis_galbana.AAC.3
MHATWPGPGRAELEPSAAAADPRRRALRTQRTSRLMRLNVGCGRPPSCARRIGPPEPGLHVTQRRLDPLHQRHRCP